MLPSQRDKAAKDAEEQRIKTKKEVNELSRAISKTFSTEEGMIVLSHLKAICGFGEASACIDPTTGEINLKATVYNESRRSLYIELRKHIKKETLIEVEFKES